VNRCRNCSTVMASTPSRVRSTVSHTKRNAERRLHDDDQFFWSLCQLRLVRDAARRKRLSRRFPDGRTADGRRLVYIEDRLTGTALGSTITSRDELGALWLPWYRDRDDAEGVIGPLCGAPEGARTTCA
jgi:hypothetical protein